LNTTIRWLVQRDMADVVDMERDSYEYPWSEADFINALRQCGCIGIVAEQRRSVVAFCIYEVRRREIEVLNLAVTQDVRRTGVGCRLIDSLKEKLSARSRRELVAIVGDDSLDTHHFLKDQGFTATSVLKEYFAPDGGDAYVMRYCINNTAPAFLGRSRISQYFDIEA